jgi:hypothetical protein
MYGHCKSIMAGLPFLFTVFQEMETHVFVSALPARAIVGALYACNHQFAYCMDNTHVGEMHGAS